MLKFKTSPPHDSQYLRKTQSYLITSIKAKQLCLISAYLDEVKQYDKPFTNFIDFRRIDTRPIIAELNAGKFVILTKKLYE